MIVLTVSSIGIIILSTLQASYTSYPVSVRFAKLIFQPMLELKLPAPVFHVDTIILKSGCLVISVRHGTTVPV